MSENKKLQINKKIEIPLIRLWLIWSLLFVFPSILSIYGFEKFSKEFIFFAKTDLISKGFDEIKNYNEATTIENFLEEQLSQIQKLNIDTTKEELKGKIDNILCGESLFCLFFDEEVNKITSIKSPNIKDKNIKNLPVFLYKKNIGELIKSGIFPTEAVAA